MICNERHAARVFRRECVERCRHRHVGRGRRGAGLYRHHDVVREKLTELLAYISAHEPTAGGKICVDTAPLMDKAWAARAGLGWLGKHSNLITKEVGSWVFIGSIILDIELEFDTDTIADHCGTCTACIDACPTDAIV